MAAHSVTTPERLGRDIATAMVSAAVSDKIDLLLDAENAVAAAVLERILKYSDLTVPSDPVAMVQAAGAVFRGIADILDKTANEVDAARDDGSYSALTSGSDLLSSLGHNVDTKPEAP